MGKRLLKWALFVVAYIGFWNLFDLVYSNVITGNGYRFTMKMDLLAPLAAGLFFGWALIYRRQ